MELSPSGLSGYQPLANGTGAPRRTGAGFACFQAGETFVADHTKQCRIWRQRDFVSSFSAFHCEMLRLQDSLKFF